jgi:hypothetical protein
MGKYDEMLRNAGIKVVSNNTSHFYSSLGFKNVNAGAGRSERFGIDNTQKSWTNKALNPIPHAAPWSYISAPGMGHFDAQQTIESFQNFRQRIGRDPFLMFDLETTGLKLESDLFHVTEIAMAKYANFGRQEGMLNIAVAPNEIKTERFKSLITKARSGAALTKEERFAIASFIRYAEEGTIDPVTNMVKYHNDFNLKKATGNLNFTNAEYDLMERGLTNITRHGVPEHQVHTKVRDFFESHRLLGSQFTLVGFNSDAFDFPAMQKIVDAGGGKGKWAELIGIANGQQNHPIDVLNLFRITHNDPTILYRRMLLNKALQERGFTDISQANRKVRRQIGREVSGQLRTFLRTNQEGLLTMDAMRELMGIKGSAHMGAFDIASQEQIFGFAFDPIARMFDKGVVSTPSIKPGVRNMLRYSTAPMEPGQMFMSMQGVRGTGRDFSIDDDGRNVYNWVFNRRAVYRYEGMFQDNDVFIAKFYSTDLGRSAFLTGSSIDEVRKKIQGGALQYINPESAVLGQEGLEDLARQAIHRWGSVDSKGYSSMRRMVKAFGGDLDEYNRLSFTEKRDLGTMYGRISAESGALTRFIEAADQSDLSPHEKTLAFKNFYSRLKEEFPVDTEVVNRAWDPTVEILGNRMSIRSDGFASALKSNLDSRVKAGSLEADVARNTLFNEALFDLRERGYLTQSHVDQIASMESPFFYRAQKLQNILQHSDLVLKENINVPVESVKNRMVQIDMARAAEIATDSIAAAKRQSRAFEYPDYVSSLFDGLTTSQTNRGRMSKALEGIIKSYEDRNLGVHVARAGNRINLYVHGGDRSTLESVLNAARTGAIPRNAVVMEFPMLTDAGNIILGGESKVNQFRLGKGFVLTDLYDELTKTLGRRAGTVAKYLAPLSGAPDVEAAQRRVSRAVRGIFEKASGSSRASTRDSFEEAFRLNVRGNDSDILRRHEVDIRALVPEFAADRLNRQAKGLDDLKLHEQRRFLMEFKEWATEKYGDDPAKAKIIKRLTGEGVKAEKLSRGFYGMMTERDFSPFGAMQSAARPNLRQWLNYYPYTVKELEDKLQNIAHRRGIGLNPFILSRTELKSYTELSKSVAPEFALAKGVSIGAIQLSSQEYMDVIRSDEAQKVFAKYGLTSDDFITPGTWKQGSIGSPELRGLLQGRQPKSFEVALDDLDKGVARLTEDVSSWIESGAKTPLEIARNQALFEEDILNRKGRETFKTMFEDDRGVLRSAEVYTNTEGRRMLRLNAEAIYEAEESVKVMHDTRKSTMSFLGAPDKSDAVSKAMHEIFGQDTHLIHLGNPKKYQDLSATLKGRLALLAEQYQNNPLKLEEIRKEMSSMFGATELVQLPGRTGLSFVIPDATQMLADKNLSLQPEAFESKMNSLMAKFGNDLSVVLPGGREVDKELVELRRMNVNETFRFSNYLGSDRTVGAGLRIGPREIRSLKAKGAIIGADMDAILNYMTDEARDMPGLGKHRQAASEMSRAIGYLVDPSRMDELAQLDVGDFDKGFGEILGRSWFSRGQLEGTILDTEKGMFALKLPTEIAVDLGSARRAISALPVARAPIGRDSQGRIFLENQNRALMNIFEDIKAVESFNTVDAAHGAFRTREEAIGAMKTHVKQYIDELGYNISSSGGAVMERAMKTRMPTSARLKAQNISANLEVAANLSGTMEIGEDFARELFEGADENIMRALRSDKGFYGIMMRDPNEWAGNFAIMNIRIKEGLQGRVARMSAVDAALANADFDGDQIAMLSPFSKRMLDMDNESFARMQMNLASVHRKQTEYNNRLANHLRYKYLNEQSIQAGTSWEKYLGNSLQDPNLFSGHSYVERVMNAHLSKTAAGPMYNLAQRYGDVGMAVFEGIDDPAEKMRRIELLNAFTETTTEQVTLKGKRGGNPLSFEALDALKGSLKRGKGLVRDWGEAYASAISDEVALSWSGAGEVLSSLGVAEGDLINDTAISRIKTIMADQMLQNIEQVRDTVDRVSPEYFGGAASKMFFSDTAYSRKRGGDLVNMFSQYLAIDPNSEAYMKSFVPTDVVESFAKATSQGGQYAIAKEMFYDKLKHVHMNNLEDIAATMTRAGGAATVVADAVQDTMAETAANVVQEASLWKKIPKWAKIGAAIGAGAIVANTAARKEPKPEMLPNEVGYGTPVARVEMNSGVEAQVNGQIITVKAKNRKNIDVSTLSDAVQKQVKEGTVNIFQKDDTSTIDHNFAQNLLGQALNYGRVNQDPNSY